jgi:hypothetical protein
MLGCILYRPRPYHHIGSPGHFDLTVNQDSGDQFLRVAVDRVWNTSACCCMYEKSAPWPCPSWSTWTSREPRWSPRQLACCPFPQDAHLLDGWTTAACLHLHARVTVLLVFEYIYDQHVHVAPMHTHVCTWINIKQLGSINALTCQPRLALNLTGFVSLIY